MPPKKNAKKSKADPPKRAERKKPAKKEED